MRKLYLLLFFILPAASMSAAHWTSLVSGTSQHLLGLSVPQANVCYVCGNAGVLLKSTDGGQTWVSQYSGTLQSLAFNFFTDVSKGYAVGDNGAAIRTNNGGFTWAPMSVTTQYLRSVRFINADTGFATGGISTSLGSVFRTFDGGATWTDMGIGAPNIIYSIFYTSDGLLYAGEYNGHTYRSGDLGSTWTTLPSGYTYSPCTLLFTGPSFGISSALSGVISITTDSAASWTNIPSGTTDALSGMDFADPLHGMIVGGNISLDQGRVLSTSDGGVTWSNCLPGSPRLVRIVMLAPELAYAVGLDGTILKYARDQVATGIPENTSGQYLAYPNPSAEGVTIALGTAEPGSPAEIRLSNASGQPLRTFLITGTELIIRAGELPAGIYLYTVYRKQKFSGSGKICIK